MKLATLIALLQQDYQRNGNVTVYVDHEYPIATVGMDFDGTVSINRDIGAVRD